MFQCPEEHSSDFIGDQDRVRGRRLHRHRFNAPKSIPLISSDTDGQLERISTNAIVIGFNAPKSIPLISSNQPVAGVTIELLVSMPRRAFL